jgi:hypothetical protein
MSRVEGVGEEQQERPANADERRLRERAPHP